MTAKDQECGCGELVQCDLHYRQDFFQAWNEAWTATRTRPAPVAPRWTHDCERCRYLGESVVEGGRVDWYHCPGGVGGLGGSIIGRTGDDGPAYWSMAVRIIRWTPAGTGGPMFDEARRRAAEVT